MRVFVLRSDVTMTSYISYNYSSFIELPPVSLAGALALESVRSRRQRQTSEHTFISTRVLRLHLLRSTSAACRRAGRIKTELPRFSSIPSRLIFSAKTYRLRKHAKLYPLTVDKTRLPRYLPLPQVYKFICRVSLWGSCENYDRRSPGVTSQTTEGERW